MTKKQVLMVIAKLYTERLDKLHSSMSFSHFIYDSFIHTYGMAQFSEAAETCGLTTLRGG